MMRARELRWSNSETRANAPRATTTDTSNAIRSGIRYRTLLNFHFGVEQRRTQPRPGRSQTFRELRPHSGSAEGATNFAVFVDARAFKHENILHGEKVSVHARDLRNGNDLARAVGEACDLHHGMHSRGDL